MQPTGYKNSLSKLGQNSRLGNTTSGEKVMREKKVIKPVEKRVSCNGVAVDEADALVRLYIFLCLGAEVQRQLQQKKTRY